MSRPKKERHSKAKIEREFEDVEIFQKVLGVHDENVNLLEKLFNIEVVARGNKILFSGNKEKIELADKVLAQMYELVEEGYPLNLKDVNQIAKFADLETEERISDLVKYPINVPARGKTIYPRSPAQKRYIDAIKSHDMIFSIGPAGTGKTYLAMAMAVNALVNKEYDRIILTRPAVEAGEKLGFLPGSMQEKVNPYLRPLYDALHDMMDLEQVHRYLDHGTIEVAPLAFMRGRTLNASFVILDEAQNCTTEQMKMFLTRMGFDSKYVVTGDITQIDLPYHAPSGLVEVLGILKKIDGIHFQYFTEVDVVRHRLVQDIIRAYERNGLKREERKA